MYSSNPKLFVYLRVTKSGSTKQVQFVLFNPDNRRRFEVPNGSGLPGIINLLIFCSDSPRSEQELIERDLVSDSSELTYLVEAGILLTQPPSADKTGFLSLYQRLVHNYPFGDYSIQQTIDDENALMDTYAEFYAPPPSYIERTGTSFALPDASEYQKKSEDFLGDISRILHFTFGSFGPLKGRHGKFFHKTSPSGGARHPSEAVIILNVGLNNIPAGVYSYDFIKHTLVDSESAEIKACITEQFKNCMAAIIIRSRVERPMWRYRDPRSYRPIIIDAGHIIETAKMLTENLGYDSCVSCPIFIADCDGEWLKEPFLVAIAIDPEDNYIYPHTNYEASQEIAETENSFVINPACFYTFNKMGILAHSLFPSISETPVTEASFKLLMRSCESDLKLGSDETLKTNGLVISKSLGQPMLEGFSFWAHHDWDLSLLAYLATSNSKSTENVIIKSEGLTSAQSSLGIPDNLIGVMLKRHTDRKLTGDGVPKEMLENLLTFSIEQDLLAGQIDVFLISFSVAGLHPGIYKWVSTERALTKEAELPDRETLRAATIGQDWASHGAASLILSYNVSLDNPATYNAGLIRLGMLGQRICIKATSLGLGTFMTPALNDTDTAGILNLQGNCENKIFYLIDIGTSLMSLRGKMTPNSNS